GARRHRAWACDLARFHRGDARHDYGRQPHRSERGGVHHPAADPRRRKAAGHRRMSAAPIKVLVVDDEPPIRKLLRMGLATQGYEILEAPNGKAALELMAGEPDLVI